MHPDMLKVINLLDQRIEKLTNMRQQLIEEFGAGAVEQQKPEHPDLFASVPTARRNGNGSARKQQIIVFLKEHGPSTRRDIIAATQIPVGTIATCLNDKGKFVNREGRWSLRNEERER